MEDLPAQHRRRLEEHPGRVEQVLAKALALRFGDRYANAGELMRGLVSASEKTPTFSRSGGIPLASAMGRDSRPA